MIARDRETALALAAAHDFDVALIDVRLPDGDGMSLLAPLRARSPFLQSVMVTGNASVEGAIAAVRGAAFAYVLKPVSPPDLLDTTRRALEQAALYRERERLRGELERSERRHRELVESVPAFVLALDEAGRITDLEPRARTRHRLSRGPRCSGRTAARLVGPDDRVPAICRSRRAASARSAGGAPRSTGRDGKTHRLRGRHRRHRRGGDAAPPAPLRTAGGGGHDGRRPGARGPQPAQLGVAPAHGARTAPRSRRRAGRRRCPSPASSRARSIASIAWCASSSPSRSPRPLEPKPVERGRAARRRRRPDRARSGGGEDRDRASTSPTGTPPVLGDGERLRQVLLNLTRNAIEAMAEHGRPAPPRGARRGRRGRDRRRGRRPGFGEELPVFDAFFTTK